MAAVGFSYFANPDAPNPWCLAYNRPYEAAARCDGPFKTYDPLVGCGLPMIVERIIKIVAYYRKYGW